MGGHRGYRAQWNKSASERQIAHDLTYMWNLLNKTIEQTKLKKTYRYRDQTDGFQSRDGRRQSEEGEEIK